jgi:hypothetical protein
MAYVVLVVEEYGVCVLISSGAAQVSELVDMDPPGPPPKQVVLHLR